MKKSVLLSVLLAAFSLNAQQKENYLSFSLKTDVKNAVIGSKPTQNKSALDLMANVNVVVNNFELSVGDELFKQIGYNRFFINFGLHSQRYIPLGRKEFDFTFVPYAGFGIINRFRDDERSSHLSVQGGMSFRTKLSDNILLDFTTEVSSRPDLQYLYNSQRTFVLSNFIGVHYILPQ